MKFRLSDIEKYLKGKINWEKIANELNEKSFEAVLNNDYLDLEILPNRFSDAASFLGLAREIASITNLKLKKPKIKVKESAQKNFVKVLIQTKKCFNYFGRTIIGIKNRISPITLKETLEFYGLNSINFAVDLSNLIMLEYGTPVHLFDFDKIDGKKIFVRESREGEIFESLTGEQYKLPKGVIVISDSKKILALAGIQGSQNCAIDLTTKNIFIEAAVFDPVSIYTTSRILNLQTPASYRFERKVSAARSKEAIEALSQLIKEELGGQILKGLITKGNLKNVKKISVSLDKIEKLIGRSIPLQTIINILKKIDAKIISKNKNQLIIQPPIERLDLNSEEDVIEEIVRIYGWHNLEVKLPQIQLVSKLDDNLKFEKEMRHQFIAAGFDEVMNYSFINDNDALLVKSLNLLKDNLIEVLNPISEQFKYYRPFVFINLLKNAKVNKTHFETFKIFEIGKCALEKTAYSNLGFLVYSKDWKEALEFIIGFLKYLLSKLQINANIKEVKNEAFELFGEINNFGFVGVLNKKFRQIYDLDKYVIIGELNLDNIKKHLQSFKIYKPLPKYPSIIRDISFIVAEDKIFEAIKEKIEEKIGNTILKECQIKDVYYLPEGKSFTLRLIFNSPERTLKDDEVNKFMEDIISYLKNFNVQIR